MRPQKQRLTGRRCLMLTSLMPTMKMTDTMARDTYDRDRNILASLNSPSSLTLRLMSSAGLIVWICQWDLHTNISVFALQLPTLLVGAQHSAFRPGAIQKITC